MNKNITKIYFVIFIYKYFLFVKCYIYDNSFNSLGHVWRPGGPPDARPQAPALPLLLLLLLLRVERQLCHLGDMLQSARPGFPSTYIKFLFFVNNDKQSEFEAGECWSLLAGAALPPWPCGRLWGTGARCAAPSLLPPSSGAPPVLLRSSSSRCSSAVPPPPTGGPRPGLQRPPTPGATGGDYPPRI